MTVNENHIGYFMHVNHPLFFSSVMTRSFSSLEIRGTSPDCSGSSLFLFLCSSNVEWFFTYLNYSTATASVFCVDNYKIHIILRFERHGGKLSFKENQGDQAQITGIGQQVVEHNLFPLECEPNDDTKMCIVCVTTFFLWYAKNMIWKRRPQNNCQVIRMCI